MLACRHEQQIAWSRLGDLERAADRLLARGLERRALHGAFCGTRPDQPARAELLGLFDELVQLAARVTRGARHHESADLSARFDHGPKDREPRLSERRRQIADLHAAPEVWLVRAVLRDGFGIGHAQERPRRLTSDEAHEPLHERLDRRKHQILGRERHLEVDLRELRLAVGPEILVAEALDDLEVAIEPRDHEDLLEDLRRLRQRVELTRMHAARYEIVARAFGRGLRQHRRFDLEKALLVEVLPDVHRDAVPQREIVLHARPPQIEIAILQARVFGDRRLVRDRKGRGLRVVQHTDLVRTNLDRAGADFRVHGLGRARLDVPEDRDHILGPESSGARDERLVVADDDLRHAVTVANIDEQERAEIPKTVHPAEQHDVLADVGCRECTAGVRSREGS